MPSPPDLVELHDLDALQADWVALWARVPDATPFQHPAWLIPWWRHVGEGELMMLARHGADGLDALFPLYVWRGQLFPLGIGTTDYLDALVAPGHAEPAMAALLRHLHASRGRFARAEWPQLRPASPLLAGTAPPSWHDATEPAEPCPALRLPARVEDLGAQVSAKTLRDLRVARRRAAEIGATVEEATAETLPGIAEALIRLHAERWRSRAEDGVLAAASVQAMHRASMPALWQAGLLRLFALRLGGEVVAVIHALADPPGRAGRSLYLYLQGFDPAHERLSPGLLLLGAVIERAIAEGFALADFLRGQERYKSFWGAADAPTFRRILTPPEPPA
jgi:CelD/BcsL family acetyltransferase involved in cellulose biosynthesis